MLTLNSKAVLSDEDTEALMGQLIGPESYHTLLADPAQVPEGLANTCRIVPGDVDVIKPNGEVLLKIRRKAIPASLCQQAFPALEGAATKNDGRGTAAGFIENKTQVHHEVGKQMRNSFRALKQDGTVSRQVRGKVVRSGVIGFFDRSGRFPYCRMTAFSLNEPEKFVAAMPFIKEVDKVFRMEMPDRYEKQMEYVRKTAEDFTIHGTAFTTVTVNMNFRTACHRDIGDLKEGFGVLAFMRAGHYDGGYLCFPKYGVAVDCRTQDVLLCDVHEVHGNTAIKGKAGAYKRLSLVLYYREGMVECGTPDEEVERAKNMDRKGVNK